MLITLYSDPHIGLSRQSHTTTASSSRWKNKLFSTVSGILSTATGPTICLGDLFDSFSNSEQDISHGYSLATKTSIILAGNHDVENRADKLSSLQLLDELLRSHAANYRVAQIFSTPYGTSSTITTVIGNTRFVFVPHTANKDLFELSLQQAEELKPFQGYSVLCLHCNYALPDSFTRADTTLNLTQERAYQLLSVYHRILIGHEHVARTDPQTDRIQLLGNVFPTSFSELSDKFYWTFDSVTNVLTPHCCWQAEANVYKGPVSLAQHGRQFYDLEDDLSARKAGSAVAKLYENDATLAVRLSKKEHLERSDASADVEEFSALPNLIEAELRENAPHLLPLFLEYLDKLPGEVA